MLKYFLLLPIIILSISTNAKAEEALFPPECPEKGTFNVVNNPKQWADKCFKAVNGRMPKKEHGETLSFTKDIDLDGVGELIEARGTGQASKTMYIFKIENSKYLYMGALNAYPEFEIYRDSTNKQVFISYYHRFGFEDGAIIKIIYKDYTFMKVD